MSAARLAVIFVNGILLGCVLGRWISMHTTAYEQLGAAATSVVVLLLPVVTAWMGENDKK